MPTRDELIAYAEASLAHAMGLIEAGQDVLAVATILGTKGPEIIGLDMNAKGIQRALILARCRKPGVQAVVIIADAWVKTLTTPVAETLERLDETGLAEEPGRTEALTCQIYTPMWTEFFDTRERGRIVWGARRVNSSSDKRAWLKDSRWDPWPHRDEGQAA